MEDAHIALTDITAEANGEPVPKFSLFAVFDGHGGNLNRYFLSTSFAHILDNCTGINNPFSFLFPTIGKEVAKFAKLKYPELVLEQLAANDGDLHVALRESFHRVDELLEDAVSSARSAAMCT
jgi:serine/threonine protein phosphatase PrpC